MSTIVTYSSYNAPVNKVLNTSSDRADLIISGDYKNIDSDLQLQQTQQADRNYFINLYFSSTDTLTDSGGNPFKFLSTTSGLGFEDDFKDDFNDDQRKKIYQQEFKYVISRVLSKYGTDRLASKRDEKVVYEKWVGSLDDDKIIEKLKDGAIDEAFSFDVYNYAAGTGSSASSMEDLIDALGFPEFFNEQAAFNFSSKDEITSVDDLQNLSADQLKTLKSNVALAKTGEELPDPSKSDKRALRQCALISDLIHQGYSYTTYPSKWQTNNDTYNKAFNGRIYPVTTNNFDPNLLINMCTMPNNVKTFFSGEKTVNATGGFAEDEKVDNLNWKLYWVYRDSEGMKETEIYKKSKGYLTGDDTYDPAFKAIKDGGLLTAKQLTSIQSLVVDQHYTIKSVNVTYDGTNPATARSDVKVDIVIDMAHISSIETPCAYSKVVSDPGKGGAAQIKLKDLVTIPQTKSVTVTTPGGKDHHINTYTPETSRIRLKVWYDEGLGSTKGGQLKTNNALILDLALIDHEIKRNSDTTNTATLTINYRGYFEESMNAPYNDALVDPSIISNRVTRTEKIKNARKEKCSDKLVRQLQRVLDEEQRIETEKFHDDGGLIKRLTDENLLYTYAIDTALYDKALFGNVLDPTVGNIIVNGSIQKEALTITQLKDIFEKEKLDFAGETVESQTLNRIISALAIGAGAGQGGGVGAANAQRSYAAFGFLNQKVEYFFYLGDLMEILLDSLYLDDTVTHHPHTKDMNTRFIVGTIEVPNPSNLDTSIRINPLQIPIDLAFFAEWYNDAIVKKGIQHYSVGPFIKDLLERLINDVLYDTCFALLELDETPPQLRSTFITDHSATWFKTKLDPTTNVVWFYPDTPFGETAPDPQRTILMKKDVSADPKLAKNYCVIYQQFPSFFRQRQTQGANTPPRLQDGSYVPTLFDGFKSRPFNFCNQVNFAKANNATYLKETRYFNNSFGNLALFANVYNLDFSISTKKVNTFMYPGCIINFIVTDFVTQANWSPQKSLGVGDPHKPGTLPNVLGLGGYFIITKVTYELLNVGAPASTTVKVTSRFIGTDARIPISGKDVDENPFADEPKNCEITYNDAVDALRDYETKINKDAYDFTHIHTDSTTTTTAAELPSLPTPAEVQQIVKKQNEVKSEATEEPAVVMSTNANKNELDVKDKLKKKKYAALTQRTKISVTVGGVKYTATVKTVNAAAQEVTWTVKQNNGNHNFETTVTHQ